MYVTTTLGVQVLDELGRVNLILNRPGDGWLSNVTFGGSDRDILYATCGDSVFKRRIKATGVDPWKVPAKQPKTGL